MKIYIEKTGKSVVVDRKSISGMELLKDLSISPDSVIIVQNGTVMLSEEKLSDKGDIKLLSVVSGG